MLEVPVTVVVVAVDARDDELAAEEDCARERAGRRRSTDSGEMGAMVAGEDGSIARTNAEGAMALR